MTKNIREIVAGLSLEEKASLCSGEDFWNLKALPEKGIPAVMLTDGPHGLRKQIGEADHLGLSDSVPATCFPTASAMAASWNPELLREVGAALGAECRQEKVAVLLGPGANIKRSPLCGRNFEYFSEDPFLSGRLAAAYIQGVQSQGIGTSLKHFVANNQERRRMTIDTIVDERAFREIYLAGFEYAVKVGKPASVMSAYNRLHGEYCSENRRLLTEILREEWGFEGFVVTDWGGVNDRVRGLAAGQDLEMPGSRGMNDARLVEAVRAGELPEATLDSAVERLLRALLPSAELLEEDYRYDADAHHMLARRVETESAVLLKNEGALPLPSGKRIGVIGAFAKEPRYQGAGSSLITPSRIDTAWDALVELHDPELLDYAPGYRPEQVQADARLIAEAVAVAKEVDIPVVFAGLPEVAESEGFDRQNLAMPESHRALISSLARANPNTVVVLSNGAPVTMPWLDQVNAVLEGYLGGQAWGPAVADLLLGRATPSGKLAETFPMADEEVSAAPNFPGGTASVAYAESVYVGYRYYDTAAVPVLFPFGHGLSYTSFSYGNLSVTPEGELLRVSFSISNTGERTGSETAQLYVRDVESSVFRPEKELKGFAKLRLEPGETKRVSLDLDRRAFAFWDSGAGDWAVEAGDFDILVGASAADIRLEQRIAYPGGEEISSWARSLAEIVPGYFSPEPRRFADLSESGDFSKLLGKPVPAADRDPSQPFDRTSTLEDLQSTFIGRIQYRSAMRSLRGLAGDDADPRTLAMMEAVVKEMPLKNLAMLDPGTGLDTIDAILLMANGKLLRGLRALIRARSQGQSQG